MLQELRGNHRAHQMGSPTRPRTAATIAIEARDRIRTTGLQFGTKDIGLIVHTPSVTELDSRGDAELGCWLSILFTRRSG